MKKFLALISVAILFAFFGCVAQIGTNPGSGTSTPSTPTPSVQIGDIEGKKYFENELIIIYRDREAMLQLVEKIEGKIKDEIPQLNAVLVETPKSVKDMIFLLKGLKHHLGSGIKAIEPNYIRELEPVIKENQNAVLKSTDQDYEKFQWALRVLNAEMVWEQGYTGKDVIIGLLDTGVDGTHPDLQGQLVTGYDPVLNVELSPSINSDTHGHGTHTAGIIAAKKDDQGVTGLAPDAKIMPIRIFRPSYAGDFAVARGIVWAVDHGAKVLSNSWGGGGYSAILADAFNYALSNNVVVVASAGNERTDQHWHYPSAFPGVIGVGATKVSNQNGEESTVSWSNRGDYVSVGAPGVNILSTIPVANAPYEGIDNGKPYAYWSGTSMACPYVSALAALILEKYPSATPYQVRKIIESTAIDIDAPGYDTASGFGRISPVDALNAQLPTDEGGVLNIWIVDRDYQVIEAAYITLENVETGKKYYGKSYVGYAPYQTVFTGIEPGDYRVIIGGPDFLDSAALNYRMEEEVPVEPITVSARTEATTVVTMKSTFEAEIGPDRPLPENVDFDLSLWRVEYSYSGINRIELVEAVTGATDTVRISLPEDAPAGYYAIYYQINDRRSLVTVLEEGFETGEFPVDWTLGGDAYPFIQDEEVHSGAYAAQFGDIDDDEESWFEFTVELEQPGLLRFWVKVSSESNYDYFYTYVDGVREEALSGEVDWRIVEIPLSSGEHTIRMMYVKDFSISRGADTAWVDDIQILAGEALEPIRLVGTVIINGNRIAVRSGTGPAGIIDDGLLVPWCIY